MQIVIGRMSLWQETAGCEEHNLLGRNFLHLLHELYSVRLGQVFNDIESDAGIELSGAKMAAEFTHVAVNDFILGFAPLSLLNSRKITLDPHTTRNAQVSQVRRGATSHVQHALASQQRFSQSEFDDDLCRIVTCLEKTQRQTDSTFHLGFICSPADLRQHPRQPL